MSNQKKSQGILDKVKETQPQNEQEEWLEPELDKMMSKTQSQGKKESNELATQVITDPIEQQDDAEEVMQDDEVSQSETVKEARDGLLDKNQRKARKERIKPLETPWDYFERTKSVETYQRYRDFPDRKWTPKDEPAKYPTDTYEDATWVTDEG